MFLSRAVGANLLKFLAPHVVALGALLSLGAPAHASSADMAARKPSAAHNEPTKPASAKAADPDNSNTDIPAPMLLLLVVGAVGLIWGRRLTAKANANKS